MTVIPTIREFMGYDFESSERIQALTGTNLPAPPLPQIRVRQVVASAALRDGQTLVLSPGTVETVRKPRTGSGQQTQEVQRKTLVIFVTPTLIDPAGNPIHATE